MLVGESGVLLQEDATQAVAPSDSPPAVPAALEF